MNNSLENNFIIYLCKFLENSTIIYIYMTSRLKPQKTPSPSPLRKPLSPAISMREFLTRRHPAEPTHKTNFLDLPDEPFFQHLDSLDRNNPKNKAKRKEATKRSKDAEEELMNKILGNLTRSKGGKKSRKTKKRRRKITSIRGR